MSRTTHFGSHIFNIPFIIRGIMSKYCNLRPKVRLPVNTLVISILWSLKSPFVPASSHHSWFDLPLSSEKTSWPKCIVGSDIDRLRANFLLEKPYHISRPKRDYFRFIYFILLSALKCICNQELMVPVCNVSHMSWSVMKAKKNSFGVCFCHICLVILPKSHKNSHFPAALAL